MRFSSLGFFHQNMSPGPIRGTLRRFRFFLNFRGFIRKSVHSAVSETPRKSTPPVSRTPRKSTLPVSRTPGTVLKFEYLHEISKKKSKSSQNASNGARRSCFDEKIQLQKSCDTVPLNHRRKVPCRWPRHRRKVPCRCPRHRGKVPHRCPRHRRDVSETPKKGLRCPRHRRKVPHRCPRHRGKVPHRCLGHRKAFFQLSSRKEGLSQLLNEQSIKKLPSSVLYYKGTIK